MKAGRSHTPKGRRARDRIVAAAELLLASRGIHGTSMRDVAAAAELPLASTIYHFARKEQLYAAVLGQIADQLMGELDRAGAVAPVKGDPTERSVGAVDALARAMVRWASRYPHGVRLLLRELLDNPTRVARAKQLPLAPFVARATAIVAAGTRAGVVDVTGPEAAVLHLVGGLSYVIVARPTMARIVGRAAIRTLGARYPADALVFARRTLGLPAA